MRPDEPLDEFDPHWPPIRLAFSHLPETADEPASNWDLQEQTAPVHSRDDLLDAAWPADVDACAGHRFDSHDGGDAPILIVEEDAGIESQVVNPTPMRPQVRRQEYRRLFSRLRSG
jgi:hypothetical protein